MFKAELFNATEWASIFSLAGAKYIVPTSKVILLHLFIHFQSIMKDTLYGRVLNPGKQISIF